MKNPKLVKGLQLVAEGIIEIADALGGMEDAVLAPQPQQTVVKKVEAKTEKKTKKVEEPVAEEPEENGADELTADQVRTALVEYATANSKEAAYKILGKYGAKKVDELKKSDYKKVVTELSL